MDFFDFYFGCAPIDKSIFVLFEVFGVRGDARGERVLFPLKKVPSPPLRIWENLLNYSLCHH
ncbi:MAG: hypothetical protein J6B71_05990, partial [Clostridia bacterium]|nr:hypothetical protein [Clostridia bacterium]